MNLTRPLLGLALMAVFTAQRVHGAEPAIRNLNIRGLQVGGSTTLIIDGDDLGKTPRLLLPFAAKQALKPSSTDKQATFDVTLDADVIPGYHHLRVVTEGGVSLPVLIGVDQLPQRLFAAKAESLPVALHGAVAGSTTVETVFTGKAGQKVLVEVEAQRLGSKLRPILHLTSPKRLQIAWSWNTPAQFGDTRLDATLPEDGPYTIALHDAEYAAAAPSFFRLKVGQWSFVDQVFPPVVARGQKSSVELLAPAPQPRIDVAAPPLLGALPLAWPKGGLWSGPRPFVGVSPHAEFVEQPAAEKPQLLPNAPLGISGRLLTPNEEDRYQVAVTPGAKVKLEVFAERYGAPLDAALVVRNEKGDVLARNEDGPGMVDPLLEYTVPEKTSAIVVGVVDALGRGGPRGVYRLVVEPQTPAPAKQFTLTTTVQRFSVPASGRIVAPVTVQRRGYIGKIDVAAASLPQGVRIEGMTIPDGADGALVTVQRGDGPGEAVVTTWRGKGADGEVQPVLIKGHPLERLQPWLATEIALAPASAKAADFDIDWNNLPSTVGIVPAQKLTLPVKVKRVNPKTVVKLTLMTSQLTPLVNNQPDPNKALRQEKPIELGDKADTGEVVMLTPVELSSPVYDVAVQAELLSPDKKIVHAVAYTPVRRLDVRIPLILALAGDPRIQATIDPKKGATVKIQGKVERRDGLKGDVTVTLAGLPGGLKANPATVKADATDFAVDVVLPPTQAAGEIKGLKLSASAAPDPKQPAQRVKSRDLELTLVVVQAATK